MINMTAFDSDFERDFFISPPPEGLFEVDIGLSGMDDFGHLQTFADLNSDKYTDMLTVIGNGDLV